MSHQRETQRVGAGSLALAAALGVTLSCNAQQLGTAHDLRIVREAISRLPDTGDVSVTLETGHVLHVSLVNSPAPDAAPGDSDLRFRRIATAAFLAYPWRSQLEAVTVTTTARSTSEASAAKSGRFRPIDLIRRSDLSEHWARQGPLTNSLYFVAVGREPEGVVEQLSRHFQETLGIVVERLPAMSVPPRAYDPARSQVVAEELIAAIARSYPALAGDVHARVIGITGDDMYLRQMRWVFGFSLRSDDERIAIVSYARMDPENLGLSRDAELLSSRAAKMVAKNIGILCFGLPLSDNPRSVMYGNIGGTDELDVMTEFFDPR